MHRVYAFDAYGTLFDVHSAVARHAGAIGADAALFSEAWRQKQLEYSWVRALSGRYLPFWDLTVAALDVAFARFPSVSRSHREALLEAYRSLSAYPEVRPALSRLKEAGKRLAILSNGSPEMLQSAVASAGIADLLDAVLSVDALKTYKTEPAVYGLVLDVFEVTASDVSFQSSNRWDIAGATAFGFHTVWVNRSSAPDEYLDMPPARVVKDLGSLLD